VVDAAYVCIFEPGHLPRFLEVLDRYLGTVGAHVVFANPQGWEVRALCESEAAAKPAFQREWTIPPATRFDLTQMAARQVFSFAEFSTAFEAHLLRPQTCGCNWSSALGGILSAGAGSATLLVVKPSSDCSSALESARARFHRVLPHLTRAFMFMKHAEEQVLPLPAVATLLRRFPVACLLTDGAGRCVDHNESFLKILPEIGIEISSGRARFADHYLQSSWQSALFETSETAVHQSILASAPQGQQWKAHLSPIQCISGGGERRSMRLILVVFEEQGFAPNPLPGSFAAVGKLTPAEVEVLSGLLQGYTAKVIAKARGASVNTVRSQIMAILSKTGHHSQKELIAAFGASSFDISSFGGRDD
jgi:DNA-binding CsgD family transcriptional regulator